MSGRLIILPKKSWHPGKRENIEKVLRDERLAAEEAAAARERAREIAQEGIVETLSKKRSSAEKRKGRTPVTENPKGRKRKHQEETNAEQPGGKGQGWGATFQHVNLFSDAEREAGKVLGQNADHQREKQEQDLQTQKRSGLAPTALGEGSAELKDKDSQPWYTLPHASPQASARAARTVRLGREVVGSDAEAVFKRDEGRKGRADPMGSLFRSGGPAEVSDSPSEKPGTGARPAASSEGNIDHREREYDEARCSGEGKKRAKDRKKDSKTKKHKKKKTKEKRKSRDHNTTNSSVGGPTASGEATHDLIEGKGAIERPTMDQLRRRRLAREGGERDRQIRLLSEREMAGQSLPDERTMAYNNQYNAHTAKQNRTR